MDQDGTLKLSRVVHACNLARRRTGQEKQEFKASLGYLARLCLKKKKKTKPNSSETKCTEHIAYLFCQSE